MGGWGNSCFYAVSLLAFVLLHRSRFEQHYSECPEPPDAEEAGDAGALPARGRGGPDPGHAGRALSGGTHGHGAHPAAPEPSAALFQSLGGGAGQRLPVPRAR